MGDIFFKLLNMSINAGWLVLAALLFRLCFKKSPKWIRCVLWAMVAVRLVIPFTIKSGISVIPSSETVEVRSYTVNESSENAVDNTSEGSDSKTVVYKRSVSVKSGIKPLDDIIDSIAGDDHAASRSESGALSFYDISGIVWAFGAFLMLLYAFLSFIRIKRQVKAAVGIEKNLMLCDDISSPFILGIFRPRIYLPTSIKEEDRKYMIAHETAHLKRGDHLWKPLGFALLSVYWFNPFIWLAYIFLCRDIELACDEKVIKDYDKQNKAGYSKALVECSVRCTSVAACPLAFGETGVKERVVKVLDYKRPAFWIVVISLIACAAAAVFLLTDPKGNGNDSPVSNESTTESTSVPGADESETSETTSGDRPGAVDHVGQVPEEFKSIVEDNLFYRVTAGDGRILRTLMDYDYANDSAEYNVQMMDNYGKVLAEYRSGTDLAHNVRTLTATEDGGFLFVLGFEDKSYGYGKWASDYGVESHVIKCDKNGNVQFDAVFENTEGFALEFCCEKNEGYYLFGSLETPETKTRGVRTATDVYAVMLDNNGKIVKSKIIAGSDFDFLDYAEPEENGFVLSVSSQSDDGDFAFSNSGGYPVKWTVRLDLELEITEKKKQPGRDFSDALIGYKKGKPVYRSDILSKGFDAGDPTAYIDYGDFYMIVSENVTGEYENTPPMVNTIWTYTETVYSAFDNDGKLIFRTSVDSSPDYDEWASEMLDETNLIYLFNVKDYQYEIQKFPSDEVIENISDKEIFLDEVEKIWTGLYGDKVKEEKPYKWFYDQKNGVWLVCGTLPENTLGGTAHILVENVSGKVLAVWHEK